MGLYLHLLTMIASIRFKEVVAKFVLSTKQSLVVVSARITIT